MPSLRGQDRLPGRRQRGLQNARPRLPGGGGALNPESALWGGRAPDLVYDAWGMQTPSENQPQRPPSAGTGGSGGGGVGAGRNAGQLSNINRTTEMGSTPPDFIPKPTDSQQGTATPNRQFGDMYNRMPSPAGDQGGTGDSRYIGPPVPAPDRLPPPTQTDRITGDNRLIGPPERQGGPSNSLPPPFPISTGNQGGPPVTQGTPFGIPPTQEPPAPVNIQEPQTTGANELTPRPSPFGTAADQGWQKTPTGESFLDRGQGPPVGVGGEPFIRPQPEPAPVPPTQPLTPPLSAEGAVPGGLGNTAPQQAFPGRFENPPGPVWGGLPVAEGRLPGIGPGTIAPGRGAQGGMFTSPGSSQGQWTLPTGPGQGPSAADLNRAIFDPGGRFEPAPPPQEPVFGFQPPAMPSPTFRPPVAPPQQFPVMMPYGQSQAPPLLTMLGLLADALGGR